MKIAISSESTIDMDQKDLDELGIPTVHFHLEQEGKAYRDDELTLEEMYDYTRRTKKMCHTSAPNIAEIKAQFDSLFAQGYDEIFHFTMSSALSSSNSNAHLAAGDNPHIHVIDCKATDGGIAILAYYLHDLLAMGIDDPKRLEELILERRDQVQCSFVISTLEFLYRGGRCSRLSLLGANLLKIHPEIVCDDTGAFVLGKKHMGNTQKCIKEYLRGMYEAYPDADKQRCFVAQSTIDPEFAKECVELAKSYGFQEVHYLHACPTNAYHSGPDVIGTMFFKTKNPKLD